MAFELTLPFYGFKLHFRSGVHLIRPLTDMQAVRMNKPLYLVAGQYAEKLQRMVLDQGQLRSLLDEYRSGEFLRDRISVLFPASADGFSHPEFELEFDFFYSRQPHGFWGSVPALGLEVFAHEAEELSSRAEEAIRLDFARNRRLNAVQELISTIWFEEMELLQHEMSLRLPTPREVEEKTENADNRWLPKVAQRLDIHQQVTFGRESELLQLERALKNSFSRNVLLVGPSGVGKTALVWEISRQMSRRGIAGQIWESTASILIKELTQQTGWQDNLDFLCRELTQTGDLLFIRNFSELFEVGKYIGNEMSIADYIRSYLSRGEVTLLSECTEEEMARIDLKSPNYLTLFHIIRLEEPREEMEQIILHKVKAIALERRVEPTDEAIQEVIRLTRRFQPYSGLPGRPIRFLESLLISEKKLTTIERSDVIRYFSEDSGMPAFMIDPAIPMQVNAIKAQFNNTVYGQEQAVNIVVDLLASVKTALTRTGKPIASLLFVGPTGVGKTELAKVLAEFMFGSRERMTRFDMSEFSSPYAVMRLIGTDFFSEGLLTSAVRREPFTVLLFDEIEKAHTSFFDLLLQLLSEGRLTDSQGKVVNFCSSIIIMTSNIGAEGMRQQSIGWGKAQGTDSVRQHFLSAVQRHFRPELFNRIDQIIPFESLDPLTLRFVVEREVQKFRQREGIRFRRLHLEIDEEALDYLGERGYDHRYGARHLQRTIREELILPLARLLNEQDPDDQLLVHIRRSENGLLIQVEADPLGLELLLEELDKITHSDHASQLRRRIQQLREGSFFLQLTNELEQLEAKKTNLKQKFWQNKADADRLSYFMQTLEKAESMTAQIEEIELRLSMATLQLEPYQPRMIDTMEQWEKQFMDLKIELLSRLHPEYDTCWLGIYSVRPRILAPFYLSILRRRSFEYKIYTVWYRYSYFNELVPSTGKEEKSFREIRGAYLKWEVKEEQLQNLKYELPDDLLLGLEIEVKGPCAFLYLQQEEGAQHWHLSEQDEETFVVQVGQAQKTPEDIHRMEFFKSQSLRRFVDSQQWRDTIYRINRELAPSGRVAFLAEHLDLRFEARLNIEMLLT